MALLCTVVYVFQAMVIGTGAVDVDLELEGCQEFGGLDVLIDLAECAVDGGALVLQFLTFNILGMPWFFGIPISVACAGSIIWAVVQLIRGV